MELKKRRVSSIGKATFSRSYSEASTAGGNQFMPIRLSAKEVEVGHSDKYEERCRRCFSPGLSR